MTSKHTISMLGFGAWGGAVSIHLARHGAGPIIAWEYLDSIRQTAQTTGLHPSLGPESKIPQSIRLIKNIQDLPLNSDTILIIGVASNYVASTLGQLAAKPKPYALLLLSK